MAVKMKIACIVVGVLIMISIAVPVIASASEATGILKSEDGFKGVYEKGKPENPGKPGGGGGGGGGKPPKEPKVDKWAVVIGIADYQGFGNDLLYPDDDAVDMYNYLVSKGYPDGNIKLLLNGKANARNILKAIDWMNSKESKETSECVFFFSGHGSYYDGYDDGDSEVRDEAIVSSDLYLILDGQLAARFASYDSQKIAFIFDTCYSGGMDDLAGSGRVVVTASDEDQLSWDGASWMQNGVFTYYYMDGLNIHDTVEGAFAYAEPLAHDFVLNNYQAIMDPQIYDQYTGDWSFV